jgi:hypothetical protein
MSEEGLKLHPIVILAKYFTWASYMRGEFDRVLPKFTEETLWNDPVSVDMFMFMSLWYAMLYVVIEGWRELQLQDAVIDDLLKSPNVDFLRLYRNGVAHFQREYFDQRYQHLMGKPDSAVWVRSLHDAFFKYLDSWFKGNCLDGSPKGRDSSQV